MIAVICSNILPTAICRTNVKMNVSIDCWKSEEKITKIHGPNEVKQSELGIDRIHGRRKDGSSVRIVQVAHLYLFFIFTMKILSLLGSQNNYRINQQNFDNYYQINFNLINQSTGIFTLR